MPDLLALARQHVQDRQGLSGEAEALVEILGARLAGADTMTLRPAELREDLGKALGLDRPPRPEVVGRLLLRLGFRRQRYGRLGAEYVVTRERLDELVRRYGEYGFCGPGEGS